MRLEAENVSFVQGSSVDDVGRLFEYNSQIYRGIMPSASQQTRDLLNSGLIDELVHLGLFPRTIISDILLEPYDFVLEHEKVSTVSYPYEWSFEMLREAALTILTINQIAAQYGYQTKDSHGYNILFKGSQPIFVDLGSFVTYKNESSIWEGYREFLSYYYYPLSIWKDGNEFLARRILSGAMLPLMQPDSYWLYKQPLLRRLPKKWVQRITHFPVMLRYFRGRTPQELSRKIPGRRGRLFSMIRSMLPRYRVNFNKLTKKITRIRLSKQHSMWESYHNLSGLLDNGVPKPSERFIRITELINDYGIETVTELAGNQGAFARYLLNTTCVNEIICTDYDSNAVDALFVSQKEFDQHHISPVVLDFVRPIIMSTTRKPNDRLQSQAVVALAVTHHLLLSQGIALDDMLKAVCGFATDYVVIEFMPLGLFDGIHSAPLPSWYTKDWFRQGLEEHCGILIEEQLEENRIVFIGILNDF